MQVLTPPAASVSGKILCALRDRLRRIDGQSGMVNDLQGRVFLRRPTYDADIEKLPAVFLRRRIGGGTTREAKPSAPFSDTTIIFDVLGVVAAGEATTLAGEELMADLSRALECPADLYLRDDSCGCNLLNQELVIVDVQVDDLIAQLPVDIVGVGVQCTFPQKYGDPNHVQR